ncbi:MAG TPA: CHASE3 domain-containing protein, partial [Candidatus Elarobacter sp.]|nr:CHASE3 domain-containing protein [Candidatus Elarobacter sp.]
MLAFLVAMAWDSFSRTRELLSSQVYVEHTHQVLYEMDAIQDGLGDAREAWLHYILTPEQQDLDTFAESSKQVWKRVARVEELTKDDGAQQERIKQLQVWISEELKQLSDNLRTNKTLLIYHSPATDFKQDRVRNAVQKFK